MKPETLSPRPRLLLPRWIAAEIAAAARVAAPREACGVLLGRAASGDTEVVCHRDARNVAQRPAERFTVAPEDILAAERAARDDRLEVVGFWHSHPVSAAVPSASDRAAAWESYSYPIVSLAGEDERLRSWRFVGGEPIEEEVVEPPLVAEGLRP